MKGVRFHRFASSRLASTPRPTNGSGKMQGKSLIRSTEAQAHERNKDPDAPETASTESVSTSASPSNAGLGGPLELRRFQNALQIVQELKPEHPVMLLHPKAAADAAKEFRTLFPGQTMYAVKANDSPDLLKLLHENGITWFDVASINEAKQVRSALSGLSPPARMCFMNPVKSPEAVREAYHSYGIRVFSLDDKEELEKIVKSTSVDSKPARDLTLCVRVRVPSRHAKIDLATKYGLSEQEVIILLRDAAEATKASTARLGICFHVGSQAMAVEDFQDALHHVVKLGTEAGVRFDIIDLSGGFPSKYPGMEPPPLSAYMQAIKDTFRILQASLGPDIELWAEPGRQLSAPYQSQLVRVEKRRGLNLYLNDGPFGTLFDAGVFKWRYLVELVREPRSDRPNLPFSCYGPTCDNDFMRGPFDLPSDIQTGDYIEIFGVGAYGSVLRTRYNGFHTFKSVILTEESDGE